MEAALALDVQTNNWYHHYQCLDATERLGGATPGGAQVTPQKGAAEKQTTSGSSPLVNEIARAREQIKKSLQSTTDGLEHAEPAAVSGDLASQVANLQKENQELRKITGDLRAMVCKLDGRITSLEKGAAAPQMAAAAAAPAKPEPAEKEEDDDDSDPGLFDSDSEDDDEEAERIKQERLAAYNAKKSTKKVVTAKSSIVFDVKPWEAETDMKALEDCVRSVKMEGLLWGASKLVPVAFGVRKLQISCVIVDEHVSTDALQEEIEAFEDYVQSTDIAAFNKI